MPPISRLGLLISVVLSLALLTTCHPRPAASSLIITVDHAQDSHVGATSAQSLKSDERAADTRLSPRGLGFQEYLDIGGGWNMYYSSWPSIALPVRKYILGYRTLLRSGSSKSKAW